MENMVTENSLAHQYRNKRVLVTGHTGFKGSWLCAWLHHLGADVAGYSVDVPTRPSHFEILELRDNLQHHEGDIRDRNQLKAVITRFEPDILFHLAAQPLVRKSLREPVETFETNVLGTVNVLEEIRECRSVRAAVFVTSDKCYRNYEWPWGYRETDMLGGKDPYSASKACAELIITSYHESFFRNRIAIASTRAGNVIGGGDWADDRIIPDAVRAWSERQPVTVRSPKATRPWQHVLEPLGGYLWLGHGLLEGKQQVAGEAFNFGPDAGVTASVEELLAAMADYWPEAACAVDIRSDGGQNESTLLKLCCDKALHTMGWKPVLRFEETVKMTATWYRTHYTQGPEQAAKTTMDQVRTYERLAAEREVPWAR